MSPSTWSSWCTVDSTKTACFSFGTDETKGSWWLKTKHGTLNLSGTVSPNWIWDGWLVRTDCARKGQAILQKIFCKRDKGEKIVGCDIPSTSIYPMLPQAVRQHELPLALLWSIWTPMGTWAPILQSPLDFFVWSNWHKETNSWNREKKSRHASFCEWSLSRGVALGPTW